MKKDEKYTEEELAEQEIAAPEAGEAENTAEEEQADGAEKELAQTPEELLAAAQEEITALKNELLYKAAEFDNYRKRTLKEKADLILNGGEKTISSLLPILDDLERAEQNMETATDAESLKEGLELVFKKLRDTLAKQGLKKIETEGKDFDVDFHEAIAMVPVQDDAQKGKVIDCVATGYMLNEKVIRHAKVAVGQ
ncbi:MAG: nucleotide exchange factor GrpE [Alloprevotella sp.]|nr:nucleotide exchange factor GrpE [Alloprevotella sp.]